MVVVVVADVVVLIVVVVVVVILAMFIAVVVSIAVAVFIFSALPVLFVKPGSIASRIPPDRSSLLGCRLLLRL